MPDWKNRIVRTGTADPNTLEANVRNWRRHPSEQRKALEAILTQIGWVQGVVVNETTGHIVDGHLRVVAAIENGTTSIPVTYVKLSQDEENLALATFDSIARLAISDDEALSDLIDLLVTEDEDLRTFLASLEEEQAEDVFSDLSLSGDNDDGESSPPSSSTAVLTFIVTAEQKSEIMDAITKAAEFFSCAPSEALCIIIRAHEDIAPWN